MFEILDGRQEFYQWDTDRKLIVKDDAITQVHFCNRTDDCSLVCEVYLFDGVRVADVPNILLQSDWPIRVYGYIGYTKHAKQFKVNSRTKPADYIYTETEVKNYDAIAEGVKVPVVERAEEVSIEPVENTEISELITWLKYDEIELADTVEWRGMDNWVIVNQGEDEWSGSWLQYLVIPTDGGIFDFEGMVGSWGADVNYVYIGNVAMDGTLYGGEMCSLECNEFGKFSYYGFEWYPSDDEAHAIAIVIDSCWPSEFLLEFSCLNNKNAHFYDGQDIQLTVVKDGVETTYSADTPCIDWYPNMGYNWLTGKGYNEAGKLIEDIDGTDWNGNAYPELANIGKATIKSKIGTVSVGYQGYPVKGIEAMGKEINQLKKQLAKQQQTINRIVEMGGFY